MRIATLNINNIRRRLPNLLAWLEATRPDIVCLQELKTAGADFPRDPLEAAGYGAVWRGQTSWNGVAILARAAEPILTRSELPGDASDRAARYIEAAALGVIVASLYAPNGNPAPGPKFDAKLAWHERLAGHAAELLGGDLPVVLAGDYNIAPDPIDVYPTRSYDDNALIQPESRAAFHRLLDQGWTDAIRARHPDERAYTFWDYRRNRWPRDAGLRLDHLLLSPSLVPSLRDAGIDRMERGKDNASDHAPVWIEITARSRRKAGPIAVGAA